MLLVQTKPASRLMNLHALHHASLDIMVCGRPPGRTAGGHVSHPGRPRGNGSSHALGLFCCFSGHLSARGCSQTRGKSAFTCFQRCGAERAVPQTRPQIEYACQPNALILSVIRTSSSLAGTCSAEGPQTWPLRCACSGPRCCWASWPSPPRRWVHILVFQRHWRGSRGPGAWAYLKAAQASLASLGFLPLELLWQV